MGVLIGVDQYWKIVTGKVVKGIAGPTAIETAFGWVLSGPVLGLTLEPTVTCLSTVHMMKVDASVCSAQQEIANLEIRLQAFHCEKFRTLISNSWPILQTSVTFPAHASIEMYGKKFIFEYHKSGKVAI